MDPFWITLSSLTVNAFIVSVYSLLRVTHNCPNSNFWYEANQNGNPAAHQPLCFHYIDSKIYLFFLNLKFQTSNYLLGLYSPVCVETG